MSPSDDSSREEVQGSCRRLERRTPHPTLPLKEGGICCDREGKSEGEAIDWRGWLSLAWMVGFGVLYVAMILREKAPGLLARISRGG
jgi:hypothetical protein